MFADVIPSLGNSDDDDDDDGDIILTSHVFFSGGDRDFSSLVRRGSQPHCRNRQKTTLCTADPR